MKYLSLFLLLAFAGCKKDEADFDVFPGQIVKIEVPQTTTLGKDVVVIVRFRGGSDGCAQPFHLETSFSGNAITFKACYKYPKKVLACPLNIPEHRMEYTFKPEAKGGYIFKSADGSVVTGIKVN